MPTNSITESYGRSILGILLLIKINELIKPQEDIGES
jgi:hypothetical protein